MVNLYREFDPSVSDVILVDEEVTTLQLTPPLIVPHVPVDSSSKAVIAGVVAENSDKELPFKVQAHDFFTSQTIRGAHAYYLHSILHDWSDEEGIMNLQSLVPALKKGYSRVLLNEIVVSEEKPTLAATSMDMMMLAHFAVRERTEANWREILKKVESKVVNIYSYPGVTESVIEAQLA